MDINRLKCKSSTNLEKNTNTTLILTSRNKCKTQTWRVIGFKTLAIQIIIVLLLVNVDSSSYKSHKFID